MKTSVTEIHWSLSVVNTYVLYVSTTDKIVDVKERLKRFCVIAKERSWELLRVLFYLALSGICILVACRIPLKDCIIKLLKHLNMVPVDKNSSDYKKRYGKYLSYLQFIDDIKANFKGLTPEEIEKFEEFASRIMDYKARIDKGLFDEADRIEHNAWGVIWDVINNHWSLR